MTIYGMTWHFRLGRWTLAAAPLLVPALMPALLAALILSSGCAQPEPDPGGAEVAEVHSLEPAEIAAAVAAAMDPTADPCQDFYRYACGGWLDTTERPADKARWTRSFSVIREENRETLQEILDTAASQPGEREERLVGTFFGSCMDEELVEAADAAPLAPYLEKIAAVEDRQSLFRVVGEMHESGAAPLFFVFVFPDFKDPDTDIAFWVQGGLGLPEKDAYFRDDDQSLEVRRKYQAHIAAMLELLGDEPQEAGERAKAILALETSLAEGARAPRELRDLERLYNKVDVAGLKELSPGLPWETYLETIGHPDLESASIATPEFFEGLDRILEQVAASGDWETVRHYLRWQAASAAAPLLSDAFQQENFAFYGRVLNGQEEMEPRVKRCVDATDEALGEALGKVFVARRFAGDSKDIATTMVDDILAAFRNNLPELAWMDDETRSRAVEKADLVGRKIGYPDRWRDYSALELGTGGYFTHALAAQRFEFHRQLSKVGQPTDRDEWRMTPPTVNAYYNPPGNEIVFTAGILQPPFFHRDFPAAMNYGAIGAVMGHELSHGFDDSGRKFDGQGQMREWWDPAVVAAYEERASCVEELYGGFEVEPGLTQDGELTLGENIADLGGIKQAYEAYGLWKARQGESASLGESPVEGLTDDQLFFVSFGQVWCTQASEEIQRLRARTDSHSNPRFRVVGAVSNLPAFGEAFGCEVGSPMRPAEMCEVW